jgi:putative ABC transport system permease protein
MRLFRENLGLAVDALRARKLRSLLTVLGVVIGVGVIVIVGALLTGFNRTVTSEVMGFGADTAFISKFEIGVVMGRPTEAERQRKPLSLEDGEALLAACPAVKAIAISIFPDNPTHEVTYRGNEVMGLDFRGVFPEFVDVYANAQLAQGRFFTDSENLHHSDVVVLGYDAAKELFPSGDPIGRTVRVDATPFRVIGVFNRPKGGFGMDQQDNRVVIPYYTFHKLFPLAKEHGFRIEAYPGQLDRAVDEARELLRRRRHDAYGKPDSFSIETNQQILAQFHEIVGGVAIATVVLSSIGLLIGGVGVMNIMLVSVTERTHEIGIRKAIGARRSDITWQFLLEAMMLTGAGGLLGIVIFGGLAELLPLVSSLETAVPLWAVGVGLVVSIGIGIVFGVWPATKAAKLDPVDALRYE